VRPSTTKDAATSGTTGEITRRAPESAQIDQLRERLTPVVDHAIQIAREQAAQAAVVAGHAREWATPRVGAAVERGRLAAAPRVEAAAERVAPAVDAARDRIVEDLLPRIVEAVRHAGETSASAKTAATETVSRTVEDAALSLAAATPSAKARATRRRRRCILLLAGAAALVSAAVAALRWSRARDTAGQEVSPNAVPTSGETAQLPATDRAAETGISPGDTAEPASPTAEPATSENLPPASNPETIGIETGLGEAPPNRPNRRD
jgi:hypothetical protein